MFSKDKNAPLVKKNDTLQEFTKLRCEGLYNVNLIEDTKKFSAIGN